MTLGAVPPPGVVALNMKTVLDGTYNNAHLYEGSLRRLVWVSFHQHVSRFFTLKSPALAQQPSVFSAADAAMNQPCQSCS